MKTTALVALSISATGSAVACSTYPIIGAVGKTEVINKTVKDVGTIAAAALQDDEITIKDVVMVTLSASQGKKFGSDVEDDLQGEQETNDDLKDIEIESIPAILRETDQTPLVNSDKEVLDRPTVPSVNGDESKESFEVKDVQENQGVAETVDTSSKSSPKTGSVSGDNVSLPTGNNLSTEGPTQSNVGSPEPVIKTDVVATPVVLADTEEVTKQSQPVPAAFNGGEKAQVKENDSKGSTSSLRSSTSGTISETDWREKASLSTVEISQEKQKALESSHIITAWKGAAQPVLWSPGYRVVINNIKTDPAVYRAEMNKKFPKESKTARTIFSNADRLFASLFARGVPGFGQY